MKRIIALGGDHAGFSYKSFLKKQLENQNWEVLDFGPYNEEQCDYPDFVHPLCQAMLAGKSPYGLLICGSGNGVAITANKYENIRAALCWNEELSRLARQHNDANVLALPARFIDLDTAWQMLQTFLQTPFEGGRHSRRVGKIPIPQGPNQD